MARLNQGPGKASACKGKYRFQAKGWLATGLMALTLLPYSGYGQTTVWNLPYVRPQSYDYGATSYQQTLLTYLDARPRFFAEELAKGWTFYKEQFINSNGLVNHKRWNGTSQIGANEAVSEGQGYGMLLAVLNNDQPTFNRIFEAANTNMWDNGRKSYFKWSLPNGSLGAATDADIDIGLALVFADELQKKGFWASYSGPVSYNTRAMDIIKSIRQNMTAQDYLLPGDNWGADGINNLNPSYFATAWMKVFNAYQKEVDFTKVIDNSYAVLAKVPGYAKGQAPDWCNTSGQQSSQGGGKTNRGMGMLSDGIRTPWRIAMDALWFNDPRAITYCKNTSKTLTEFNNATWTFLAAQMAHYDDQGKIVPGTAGSFSEIAMWSTAVMGAKDAAYTKPAMKLLLVSRISGNSSNWFGDNQEQDHQFYYKQSISMLGFAVIGGHFPNVLADEKVKPTSLLAPRAAQTSRKGAAVHFASGSTARPFSVQGQKALISQTQNSQKDLGTLVFDASGRLIALPAQSMP
jgi:endo-1,4-beta-D-glucanase Y